MTPGGACIVVARLPRPGDLTMASTVPHRRVVGERSRPPCLRVVTHCFMVASPPLAAPPPHPSRVASAGTGSIRTRSWSRRPSSTAPPRTGSRNRSNALTRARGGRRHPWPLAPRRDDPRDGSAVLSRSPECGRCAPRGRTPWVASDGGFEPCARRLRPHPRPDRAAKTPVGIQRAE